MTTEFLIYVLAGFVAQLIDGALGMAYGVTASTLLLSSGVTPAAASATVHASECLTTGMSALSHHAFGNIDRFLECVECGNAEKIGGKAGAPHGVPCFHKAYGCALVPVPDFFTASRARIRRPLFAKKRIRRFIESLVDQR
jgi:hypothetical protein